MPEPLAERADHTGPSESDSHPAREIAMRIAVLLTALAACAAAAAPQGDSRKAFQGVWTIVQQEEGKKGEKPVVAPTVVFEGEKYTIKAGDKVVEEGTFSADASKTPNRIEVTVTAGPDKGKKWHGVYELEGDTLRAVVGPTEKDRPTKLADPPAGTRAFTLKRVKR
jgi:uncharacterized protein (TIGR03067 family)